MYSIMNKTLKRCLYLRYYEREGDSVIELLKYQGIGSWRSPRRIKND